MLTQCPSTSEREPTMSKENVGKFYEVLREDEVRRNKLLEIGKGFSGKELDEAARCAFAEKYVIPMAEEMGVPFSVEDLRAYETEQIQQARTSADLDQSELEAVSGGATFGFCYVVGIALGWGLGLCIVVGISA